MALYVMKHALQEEINRSISGTNFG